MHANFIELIPRDVGKALNLAERNQVFSRKGRAPDKCNPSIQSDVRWLTKKFFGNRGNFFRYLKSIPVDPSLISFLLQEPVADNASIYKSWRKVWAEATTTQQGSADGSSLTASVELLCGEVLGFALGQMTEILYAATKHCYKLDKKNIFQDFKNHLRQSLSPILIPSIIVETNLARLKFTAASANGGTVKSFAESLADKEIRRRFWNKYPVLWRLVSVVVQNTLSACAETIARANEDRPKIANEFGISEKKALTSIAWGSGDAHREHRVVAVLSFGNKKLVYKPRPIAIDRAYNEFVTWYGGVDKTNPPKPYRVLDCKTYGYVEYIKARACKSRDEVEAFYKKLGSLIAISWLLGITDLHHENVIASGNNPYLVDVEAMLDRPVRHKKKNKTFNELYAQASRDLLFRIGLLPARMKGVTGVFDVSAIGASGNQSAPIEVLTIENFDSDKIKMVARQGLISQSQNSPAPHDPEHRPHHYTKDIAAGFEHTMGVLRDQKTSLLANGSPLRLFNGLEVRWVARATMDYGKLLEKMVHPTVLGDAVQCEMLISGELSSIADAMSHFIPIIPSEVADLWNCDIPYFWSLSDSTDLYDSRGKVYKDFFEETGAEGIRNRLETVGQNNLAQSDAITLALKSTASTFNHEDGADIHDTHSNIPLRKTTPENLTHIAAEIGERLIAKAHYIERVPFWSGLTPLDDKNYTVGVLPPNLYDGAAGIGLFMAHLYRQTGDKTFKQVALDIHNHIGFLLRTKSGVSTAGAFSGLASLLYADCHISHVLGLDCRKRYDRSFKHLKRLVENDDSFDIISGAAGALIVALRYYQRTGSRSAYATAQAAAEKLSLSAEPQKIGVAWNTMKSFEFPERLGGVSHGVSGIAWALSEWAACIGESRWSALAQKAFAYEQSLFDNEAGTWKDVRNGSHSCFWCYGAAGIGLVAHNARNTLGAFVCDEIVSRAKEATWKAGASGNHGLCHGDLGNVEIFRAAGDQIKADALVLSVINDYESSGEWKCGMPDNAIVPGLMCGLAGIGYGLLRHAHPAAVPNALELEFPTT